MRWPASRLSRAATSGASAIRRVSKRNCAAVDSLLTFCPPGPEARTKAMSMSFSSIERSREIRSMASPEWSESVTQDSWFVTKLLCWVWSPLVRRSRGCGCRLCGGLRGMANHHGHKALPPQPLSGLFGIVQCHAIDDGVALFDVVDGEPIELILQQRAGELR